MKLILLPGGESAKRVALLIKGTSIRSPSVIAALHDHLCLGVPQRRAAGRHCISVQELNRAVQCLTRFAAIVEDIKALDWQHLSSNKR